jgi:anti-sigma regulatory factor (Ser/Thr protein kinase)
MTAQTGPESRGETAAVSLLLEPTPEAPSIARAGIIAFCDSHDLPSSAAATATLLVSEVVSNAVIHPDPESRTTIRLFAQIDDQRLRVEVIDGGHGFTPRPRDPRRLGSGHGLYLLEKTSSRWGVDRQGGTRVWFEVAVS